ncbi:MAG: trypsin-like peptidase domain-containing protein [Clostridia bacterium]|nr:trypsin-like peptidase domain-containing protein [Clostridia bacterium]
MNEEYTNSPACEETKPEAEQTYQPAQPSQQYQQYQQAPQVQQAQPYQQTQQPYKPYEAPRQAPYQPPYQAPYQPYQPQQPQQPQQAQPYAPAHSYQQTYYTPAHSAPVVPKKKSTGAKVMLILLWVLLGLFSLTAIGTLAYFMGARSNNDSNHNNNNPFYEYFAPFFPDGFEYFEENEETKPQQPTELPTEPVDNSELFGDGEIILNKYPTDSDDSKKYNNQTAFEKVSPSAVGIMCYSDKDRLKPVGQGTGIVLNTDGYIVTNSHVIGDSKANFNDVVLSDGTTYEAKVVGFDTRTDLAVIKITAQGLVPAEFADSDLVSIGEDVIAVGNPGGMEFQNTLTRGVVSAKDRTLGLSTQVKYIQTDAAINPGNSGGPLSNLCGQVIGVNSAKIASEDYEGMGFAIPSRTVKEVVDDLIRQGYVSGRVKIGITGTAVTEAEAYYNDVPQGILVSEIIEGGPCDNGKVKTGDIITGLDDYEIKSFSDIYNALMNYSEGDKATLKLYRPDTKEELEVKITLQADR